MSADEHLDPIPDSFILQPPVFHPVSRLNTETGQLNSKLHVVPYVTTIFGGLYAGKMVMLQGVVPLHARRFQVDFQCGCCLHPRPDIAFHFNPRFYTVKPHVICNTLQGGLWQKEVRWPGVTLQKGASFLILFLFENEEVKVSVNGQHFLHFCYQLPLSRVDTLGIYGDILVKAVGFLNINPFVEGRREYPVGYPFLLYSPRLQWEEGEQLQFHLTLFTLQTGGTLLTHSSSGSPSRASHCSSRIGPTRAERFHPEPEEWDHPCSSNTQSFLHRQNTGLGLLLGTKKADLSALPLLPPAIFRGTASMPGGRAEAGTQWAGAGSHQPEPESTGAATGAQDHWKCSSLLCPLLRRAPKAPNQRRGRAAAARAPQHSLTLLSSWDQ
ncbi:galectin-12 isoform X3 [Mesocricetus auratus]|uniref:Galectin n=2 Tax=Mesocricetus auratus TaxID=10036 RepID=A0ABM2XN67_MESAU|nr:galectin-12 isoform X3 [Mesocricetus auratus]